MLQSLVRKSRVDDIVAEYGHVIVDECHHVPAFSFERVMAHVRARFILGLTATPKRRDGHDPITEMQLGPGRFAVLPREAAAFRPFSHRLVIRETGFRLGDVAVSGIQQIHGLLATDEARNRQILDDVIQAVEEGRSPILLTEWREHLEYFAQYLHKVVRHLIVLRGGLSATQRRAALATLAAVPDSEERLVLATGRYIGEGFDDARLDTLFLTLPISWTGTLVQYAGRLHRMRRGEHDVRIYDYVDVHVPILQRMFGRRANGYRTLGYVRTEPPPAPGARELTIHDDGASDMGSGDL